MLQSRERHLLSDYDMGQYYFVRPRPAQLLLGVGPGSASHDMQIWVRCAGRKGYVDVLAVVTCCGDQALRLPDLRGFQVIVNGRIPSCADKTPLFRIGNRPIVPFNDDKLRRSFAQRMCNRHADSSVALWSMSERSPQIPPNPQADAVDSCQARLAGRPGSSAVSTTFWTSTAS